MDNHAGRPEIATALSGAVGESSRHSATLDQDMLYLALPVVHSGHTIGVVRTSVPITAIDAALRGIYWRMAAGGVVIAALAALITLLISQRLSRPLEELKTASQRFAAGELELRLPDSGSEEIGGLADAMNDMAQQLDDRIRTVVEQRNEQQAVLSSMVEAVIAIEGQKRIMSINKAAATLLDVDADWARGRSIEEVSRTPGLHRFVERALASNEPVEEDLTFHGPEPRYLQAHGSPVHDSDGHRIGAVVVLNDITRMRRLETVRRDFVANVSHELKTPITSIKGFLDTLREGAISDPHNAKRFVEIAARQADRLSAIIDDLLVLSRLEQETDERSFAREPARIVALLRDAVDVCSAKAEAKNVRFQVRCDETLQATVNAPLLEQAIVNLVDNAIKYSDTGDHVEIRAHRTDGHLEVLVRDHGCGIDATHLPRLFERFYRIDKARSRKLGGTGLGLAIVKHIAQAHGGSATVESSPGRGTTFRLSLPVDDTYG